MKNFLIIFFFLSLLNAQKKTDLSYYLPDDITYNESIPTPESIIGYQVGEWHVNHDKLVFYMHALAKSSNRISISNRGFTYEGRPLLLLTITSPENHSNIESIRTTHISATENDTKTRPEMPAVVYQGYSIHGNEPSGSNASLLLAYYLAAAEGEYIDELLNNTIILLDPSLNPDGLQRFAYWANTNRNMTLNPDPNDREYTEVWPGGRTNHYWFDMNRDWLPAQLPESKARIKTFHEWLPNILTDHHEMSTNSTFFFQPGVPSRTHPLTPKLNQELTKTIGTFHAKALDNIGSLYFTEENYDDFFYGKGSSFPDINGGIGILFEQASSRGHIQESDNGLLTFPFSIRNQFITSLSTLDAAKELRKELLDYQYNFFKNARIEGVINKNKAIVFGDDKDATKAYHLAEILNAHKIKIHELKNDLVINGTPFKKQSSYIVPKNQKNIRLLTAMFEKRTKFQDSLFYDISAWTLPLAFNLDYLDNISVKNVGQEIVKLRPKIGEVTKQSDYAYLMEWHGYYSPQLLYQLLKNDIRVKFSKKQFSIGKKGYDYGTLLIPVQNQKINSESLYNLLTELAETSHVHIEGIDTGITKGIDLGSSNFKPLKTPKIGLLVGDGITPYDAGEIWHLLDTRYQMIITKLDTKKIVKNDLTKYNTIIIPNSKSLSDTVIGKLKAWTKHGGHIIGYRNTLKWLNEKEFIKLDIKEKELIAKNISYENQKDFKDAQKINGAIFEAKIDKSHPINYGFNRDKISLFRNTTVFINPDENSYNNPIIYTKKPLLSGYISKTNLDSLKSTIPFQSKKLGKGKVIVFTDNTNFRGFWYGTNKLLMNAIFFREEL